MVVNQILKLIDKNRIKGSHFMDFDSDERQFCLIYIFELTQSHSFIEIHRKSCWCFSLLTNIYDVIV